MPKTSGDPFQEPLRVVFIDGEVVVVGPAHMHGAFTAEAARLSADRLADAARAAQDPEASPPIED
jgi:hypothetical protein